MSEPVSQVRPQPGNGIGQRVPDGYYTRATAAARLSRSPDTLRRWHERGVLVPSHWMAMGTLKVWLYSDDDIALGMDVAAHQRVGRPRKEVSDGA